jgi:hypothetical protein
VWSHQVVDAAPPDTPLDVKVSMPVMKGVKVWVYYRGAGEEEFKSVLMKRHGPDKVGRIPAGAMQGKAIQYYIEAKDPAGTVVKSSGTQASPNIVMIDPSAPAQVVASREERRRVEEEPAEEEERPHKRKVEAEEEEERPVAKKRPRRNVEEEEAPVTGNLDEEEPKAKPHKKAAGPKSRFGTLFWAGIGLAAGGVAMLASGIALGAVAKQNSDTISRDNMMPTFTDNNGMTQPIYFNNDPNAVGIPQDAQLQSQGQLFDKLGIAFDVIGGVAVAGGAALIVAEVLLKQEAERPKIHKKKRRRVIQEEEEESKATPWYLTPETGKHYVGVGGGFRF